MSENKIQAITILKVANGYITIPMNMDERANFTPVEFAKMHCWASVSDLLEYLKGYLT